VAKKIGSGGFGEVFLGSPRRTGESSDGRVAIKRYRERLDSSGRKDGDREFAFGISATAVREIANLRSIGEHPNVVALRDVGFAGHRPFAVFDLYPQDLMEAAKEMDSSTRRKLAPQIAEQLCRALAHLDALGIVHRDVKLENVLCRRSGGDKIHVALCDLGSSRYVGDESNCAEEISNEDESGRKAKRLARRISEDASLTLLAPEMRDQRVCDHLSDVYLMANCVFEFVSMRTLEEPEIDRPEFLARLCGVPPLARCFSRNPRNRPRALEALALLRVPLPKNSPTDELLRFQSGPDEQPILDPVFEPACVAISRNLDRVVLTEGARVEDSVQRVVAKAIEHDRNRLREPELTVAASLSLVCKFDGRVDGIALRRALGELLGFEEQVSASTRSKMASMEWAVFASVDFNLRPFVRPPRKGQTCLNDSANDLRDWHDRWN
jgi:serine/threonine protein kinase